MSQKERYRKVLEWFQINMPVAESELKYKNPFQLAVSVILSAQCTDKRVNLVTPALFERFPDPVAMSGATAEEIFRYIRSVTYPNNKSKHLSQMAKVLVSEFNGVLPEETKDLQRLPGVGRKSANVIASVIYDSPVIAVDTHVFRISRRLGLSKGETPLAVEKELTDNIPPDKRAIAHHWLILHGRYICVARKPKCEVCGLALFCLYYHMSGRTDLHKSGTR
ncbi:MAG: endonuclease III [Bacteroidales bacterium]|nr:endonuclease III [Bacteroidales bacterium]